MPERNRVDPYGEIAAAPLRGSWMGNRGCIHRGHDIVRAWNTRRWITCSLEYKGWTAPRWVPGRWTALFFYDEALALAAGHRPCALCRREAYNRYRECAGIALADDIDLRLHAERLDGKRKRISRMSWRDLPTGTYVEMNGAPCVVLDDCIRPWSFANGYGSAVSRPPVGDAAVLTPRLSVEAIAAGYVPQISV